MTPQELLKKYWNYDAFRAGQLEVIESVVAGEDTLAIMPTGGGKSVCFQVSSMMLPGICLVITPLIALMKDQVANLKKRGIFALAIHSGMNYHQVETALKNAAYGNFKFLYVSPERLESELFQEYLTLLKINLVAIDEAHCISQWGYDFRPSYLKIALLREALKDTPFMAVTASATENVQIDICKKLEFKKGFKVFKQRFDRPNLSYSVFEPASKETKLLQILNNVPGSSIVYCKSRKLTQKTASLLKMHGIVAEYYHAGLSSDQRNQRQDDWLHNKTRVICCTNAFGMGIDKPDVRTVIHLNMPDALEYYYQEAGRAGRDGKKSYAVLLMHQQEILDLKNQSVIKFPSLQTIRDIYASLGNYFQVPAGKGEGQMFDFDPGRFAKNFHHDPILTLNVLKILEQEEILSFSQQFFSPSTVEFIIGKRDLEIFEKDFPEYNNIIKGLLRSYDGILEYPANIDEYTLSRFLSLSKAQIIDFLKKLNQLKIIDYILQKDGPQVLFLRNRLLPEELTINRRNLLKRKSAYEKRLTAMIKYATQKTICRSRLINDYFGAETTGDCCICDVCIDRKQKQVSKKEFESIRQIIFESDGISVEELRKQTGIHKEKLLSAIRFLKDEDKIRMDERGNVLIK